MGNKTIRLADVGTFLIVRFLNGGVPVDISSGTQFNIVLIAPSGTTKTFVATGLVPLTDGRISYDIQTGDIDEKGIWQIYGTMTSPAGFWKSTNDYFSVED